jgi:hypothetical protein
MTDMPLLYFVVIEKGILCAADLMPDHKTGYPTALPLHLSQLTIYNHHTSSYLILLTSSS